MSNGYLSLVLHAHLPFVRHPEHDNFLEERWLFEAISESYIPLLKVFEGLRKDNIAFKITLSITPTLISMLIDPLLQDRYLMYLKNLIELTEKELERTKSNPQLHKLAIMYNEKYTNDLDTFNHYNQNIVMAFKKFQDLGNLEIITSCATHAFLPLMTYNKASIKAQIDLGMSFYEEIFNQKSRGLWLPECGYTSELEPYLTNAGVEYSILESHGIIYSDPAPIYGTFSPIASYNGIAYFGRDAESSRQVWNSDKGFPSHPEYRDFYDDIGYSLPLDYIEPYINPDGIRINTGIKYSKITGLNTKKDTYDFDKAKQLVSMHADDFITSRENEINIICDYMDKPPIVVCSYDAELFGHWWYEGPIWIDSILRKIAAGNFSFSMINLGEYIDKYPVMQVCTPSPSSWGNNGYNEFWLNTSNDWIYRHINNAGDKMTELVKLNPDALGSRKLALNQSLRELLLLQSSDWPFILKNGTTVKYAKNCILTHLERFNTLYEQIKNDSLDESWLEDIVKKDNIFPNIDYRTYSSKI